MIKLTLVTIISIITMSTCQPITNIESTEAGILITYSDGTGYYHDFWR